jgi:3-hydroxybutyryl-CoA dehydrogenase
MKLLEVSQGDKKVMKVAVIGSGTMGPGIAQVFAQTGHDVNLVDLDEKALRAGIEAVKRNLHFFVENGIVTSEQSQQTIGRISTSTDLNGSVKSIDLAVEAVPERLELKQAIFAKIEQSSPRDAILATNTSSLSITQLAMSLKKDPSRVIGTHFLNPPHLVPIVEVVLGSETSRKVADRVVDILKNSGKKPVVVKDVPGFVHNRLICALMREAMYMAANNIASIESIDAIVKEAFGPRFPLVGIFGLEDMVGLDVLRDVSNQVFPSLDNSSKVNEWLEEKIASGKLGVKTGSGFYEWTQDRSTHTRQLLTQRFVEVLKRFATEE